MALKPRTAAIIALAILLGLTAEMVFRLSQVKPLPEKLLPEPAPAAATPAPPSTPVAQPPKPLSRLHARIEELLAKLKDGTAGAADLAQLERDLTDADPREAITAILEFLKTGRDATTGSEFNVGEKGQLATAPTLRVTLMDWLGRLSRKTGGAEAASLARSVLTSKGSADEWAVSLRNVAWHEPHATAYLSAKTREMLSHAPWLTAPSTGMLEAFDVAVFTRDPSVVPMLASMISGESRALQRAAAVALDRLSEAAPLQVMSYLNGNPLVMADRPFVRADYFAKADLADPLQKQAVEVYLARADVLPEEKSKFLKGLATPASFVSDNLLTESATPVEDDSARSATLAKVTDEWLKTPRFSGLQGELRNLHARVLREGDARQER